MIEATLTKAEMRTLYEVLDMLQGEVFYGDEKADGFEGIVEADLKQTITTLNDTLIWVKRRGLREFSLTITDSAIPSVQTALDMASDPELARENLSDMARRGDFEGVMLEARHQMRLRDIASLLGMDSENE